MTDRISHRAIEATGYVGDGAQYLADDGTWKAAGGGSGSGVVETILPGTGIAVDSTDPANPIVSATGGGGGGGSLLRNVDDPADPSWGTPSAYDLEFDTDGTSLPAGWSWFNQGTSTWEKKFGAGILTEDINVHVGIARALPTETTWTAYAKVSQTAKRVNWHRVGLCLRDSVSKKMTELSFTSGVSWNTRDATVNDWNDSTFSGGEVHYGFTAASYLRLRKNADGTYDFHYSDDCIKWQRVATGKTPFATYDLLGFVVSNTSGSSADNAPGLLHWFRVR